jgi:hypothetical protein
MPFCSSKTRTFAKTGSGQTSENLKEETFSAVRQLDEGRQVKARLVQTHCAEDTFFDPLLKLKRLFTQTGSGQA